MSNHNGNTLTSCDCGDGDGRRSRRLASLATLWALSGRKRRMAPFMLTGNKWSQLFPHSLFTLKLAAVFSQEQQLKVNPQSALNLCRGLHKFACLLITSNCCRSFGLNKNHDDDDYCKSRSSR